MISIYAFSLFLWIFLAVQEPAQGVLKKIKTAKRTDHKTYFTLTLEYEGDLGSVHYKDPQVTHTEENGKVVFKVENPQDLFTTAVYLGDLNSHFLRVNWQLRGTGDRSDVLNYKPSDVKPGPSVIIGETKSVSISTNPNRGSPVFRASDVSKSVYGEYMDGGRVTGHETVPFITVSQEKGEKDITTTFTFEADAVEGYYFWTSSCWSKNSEEATIENVAEYIIMTAHKENQKVPFNHGFEIYK